MNDNYGETRLNGVSFCWDSTHTRDRWTDGLTSSNCFMFLITLPFIFGPGDLSCLWCWMLSWLLYRITPFRQPSFISLRTCRVDCFIITYHPHNRRTSSCVLPRASFPFPCHADHIWSLLQYSWAIIIIALKSYEYQKDTFDMTSHGCTAKSFVTMRCCHFIFHRFAPFSFFHFMLSISK